MKLTSLTSITVFLGLLSTDALFAQSNTTTFNQSNISTNYYSNISNYTDNEEDTTLQDDLAPQMQINPEELEEEITVLTNLLNKLGANTTDTAIHQKIQQAKEAINQGIEEKNNAIQAVQIEIAPENYGVATTGEQARNKINDLKDSIIALHRQSTHLDAAAEMIGKDQNHSVFTQIAKQSAIRCACLARMYEIASEELYQAQRIWYALQNKSIMNTIGIGREHNTTLLQNAINFTKKNSFERSSELFEEADNAWEKVDARTPGSWYKRVLSVASFIGNKINFVVNPAMIPDAISLYIEQQEKSCLDNAQILEEIAKRYFTRAEKIETIKEIILQSLNQSNQNSEENMDNHLNLLVNSDLKDYDLSTIKILNINSNQQRQVTLQHHLGTLEKRNKTAFQNSTFQTQEQNRRKRGIDRALACFKANGEAGDTLKLLNDLIQQSCQSTSSSSTTSNTPIVSMPQNRMKKSQSSKPKKSEGSTKLSVVQSSRQNTSFYYTSSTKSNTNRSQNVNNTTDITVVSQPINQNDLNTVRLNHIRDAFIDLQKKWELISPKMDKPTASQEIHSIIVEMRNRLKTIPGVKGYVTMAGNIWRGARNSIVTTSGFCVGLIASPVSFAIGAHHGITEGISSHRNALTTNAEVGVNFGVNQGSIIRSMTNVVISTIGYGVLSAIASPIVGAMIVDSNFNQEPDLHIQTAIIAFNVLGYFTNLDKVKRNLWINEIENIRDQAVSHATKVTNTETATEDMKTQANWVSKIAEQIVQFSKKST